MGGLDQEERVEVMRVSDWAVRCVLRAGLTGKGRIWSNEWISVSELSNSVRQMMTRTQRMWNISGVNSELF